MTFLANWGIAAAFLSGTWLPLHFAMQRLGSPWAPLWQWLIAAVVISGIAVAIFGSHAHYLIGFYFTSWVFPAGLLLLIFSLFQRRPTRDKPHV